MFLYNKDYEISIRGDEDKADEAFEEKISGY